MKHTPDPILTSRTRLASGGMNLGTSAGSPLQRLLGMHVMHAENDDTGTGAPAAGDQAATDAAAAAAAAAAADAAAAGDAAGDAEPAYALPEGYDAMDDDALTELFSTLDSSVEAAKAIPENEVTALDLAGAKARREAQATITALLQTRIEERATIKAGMADLDADVPVLPTAAAADDTATPAAKAAAAASAITAVRDRARAPQTDATTDAAAAAGGASEGGQPRSRMAAVAATQTSWLSTFGRSQGETASWSGMLRETKPTGGRGHVAERPEAILAATRVEDDQRNWDFELTDSPSQNDKAMTAAMEDHRARRAEAAGAGASHLAALCDPATVMRTAMVCGHTLTPHQNALVGMTAQSGNGLAYEYRQPTSISEAYAGIGIIDADFQAAIDPTDPDTWKPCVRIACPGYDDAEATEITACYEIDAFTELSSPEAEADFVHAKDRAFARTTEAWHLRETDKFLHYVDFNGDTGAVTDVIEAILTAVVSGEYGERLEPGSFLVEGSPGLHALLAIDENKKAFRSGSATMDDVRQIVADATGTDYLQLFDLELADNGTLKPNPFGSFGAVGADTPTPMPRLSEMTFTLRVFDPSSIVRFDTGEAQFGDQITLDQAKRNERGFFQRIFGGQMKPGCAPGYKIDITLCADGSRGGFVAPGCPPGGFTSDGDRYNATPNG